MSEKSSTKTSRTYLPIWEKLKKEGKVFVKCKNASQARVIKAVQKEKYMDEDKDEMLSKMEVIKHKHGVEFKIIGKLDIKDF